MLALIPFAKKFFSRMVVAVLVTTLLSGFGIVAVTRMIDSRFDNLKRTEVNVAQDTGAGEPANFLLIGSDTRSFVSNDKDKQSFTDSDGETGQRSDTMMIIRVDPKAKRTLVMAIPRDLRVDIPGIGIQKINASFNQDLNVAFPVPAGANPISWKDVIAVEASPLVPVEFKTCTFTVLGRGSFTASLLLEPPDSKFLNSSNNGSASLSWSTSKDMPLMVFGCTGRV